MVGFEFIALAVLRQRKLRPKGSTTHDQTGPFVVRQGKTKSGNAGADQHSLLHALNTVPGCRMNNLVPQNRGKLSLVVKLCQQATVNGDLASGKGPGIGYTAVQNHEFVGQVRSVADPGHFLANLAYIERQLRIHIKPTALGLLGGHVLLGAHGELLAFTDQRKLIFPGNRIDRAAAECQCQRNGYQAVFDGRQVHSKLPFG